MREVIRQLKGLRYGAVDPSNEWLENSRALLLSQIGNTVSNKKAKSILNLNMWPALALFMPRTLVYNVLRPVAVMLVVCAIGVGGWVATVEASYDSLPGEWLYSAKRVAEKTQVTMAAVVGDKKAETELHVIFAKRRLNETKRLIQTNDPSKIQKATEAVKDLQKEITNVNTKLDELKLAKLDSGLAAAEMAKSVTLSTEQLKDDLSEVKVNLIANGSTSTNDNLTDNLSAAREMVKDAGVKAVEVMVAKHIEGDNSVTKAEVVQAINVQAQSTIKEAVASKESASEMTKAVGAVQSEVNEQVKTDLKNLNTTSTSAGLSIKVDEAAKQTQNAAAKTAQYSDEASKKAVEAKLLLATNNLTQAIDKVKEASDVSKVAEKAMDSTIKSAQSVLPAMTVKSDDALILTTTTVKIITPIIGVTSSATSTQSLVVPVITATSGTIKK